MHAGVNSKRAYNLVVNSNKDSSSPSDSTQKLLFMLKMSLYLQLPAIPIEAQVSLCFASLTRVEAQRVCDRVQCCVGGAVHFAHIQA